MNNLKNTPTIPYVESLIFQSIYTEVKLTTGQNEYRINEEMLKNVEVVGIVMRKALAGRKTRFGLDLPAEAIYNSTFLTIDDGNVKAIENFPVDLLTVPSSDYIKVSFQNGIMNDRIKLTCVNAGAIAANTAFEIIFIVKSKC